MTDETPDRPTRRIVFASIMLATFMVAMEATIVATAMPSIVGQVGGFAFYAWVFSSYLLAQCTTTMIFGKLSDVMGRKPVILAGIAIFLLGSLLAGFASSMAWLIAFRVLQGIGAGAIQPTTITLVGDLSTTAAERAKIQGLVAAVWAGAAVVGPLTGGLIVEHLSWAWVFWINLPVGVLTAMGFVLCLHERVSRQSVRIDYLGAVLFAVSIVCFLLILTGTVFSPAVLTGLAAASAASGIAFVVHELRVPNPIIPLELWARRLVAASNAAAFLAGVALIGVTTVLPLYVQGVMGRSATVAGFALMGLLIGWPLSMSLSAYFFKMAGVQKTLRAGSLMLPVGAAILLLLTADSSPLLASAGSFAMGIGMGLISITSIVLAQESVEWAMRGSVTSSIMFSRSLGNAVGAVVAGAIMAMGIMHFGRGGQGNALHRLLDDADGLTRLAGDPGLRSVLGASLHWSFWGLVLVSAFSAGAAWLLPVSPEAKGS